MSIPLGKRLSRIGIGLAVAVLGVGVSLAQDDPVFTVIARFDQTSVHDLEVSPDGSMLAVALTTGIDLYSTADLTLQASLNVDEWPDVSSISWSPDSSTLAAGYEDGLRLWDIEKKEIDWSYLKIPDVTHLQWNNERRLLVLNMGFVDYGLTDFIHTDLRIVHPYTDSPVMTRLTDLYGNTNQAVWSPDASQILYLHQVGGFIVNDTDADLTPLVVHPYLWSQGPYGSGSTALINDDPFPLISIAWSPDGTQIAMALIDGLSSMAEIQIRDTTGVLIKTLPYGWNPVWSADGSTFAVYQDQPPDAGFLVWDGALENSRRIPSGYVKQFVLSPDGTRIYADQWGELIVYDISD